MSPPSKSYPIVGVSYLLFYGQNNGVHTSDKTKLIQFLESNKGTNVLKKLEYSPLDKSVQKAVLSALNGSGTNAPCLQ